MEPLRERKRGRRMMRANRRRILNRIKIRSIGRRRSRRRITNRLRFRNKWRM